MKLSIIVAMSKNRVIGQGGALPWRLPADLKWFKERTTGHTVIMGRKTYESIGRPLPNRLNIVVSARGFSPADKQVLVVSSLSAALELVRVHAPQDVEPFIIGGGALYDLALRADIDGDLTIGKLYITLIDANIDGDTYFPPLSPTRWVVVDEKNNLPDEKNQYPFTFVTYEKNQEKN